MPNGVAAGTPWDAVGGVPSAPPNSRAATKTSRPATGRESSARGVKGHGSGVRFRTRERQRHRAMERTRNSPLADSGLTDLPRTATTAISNTCVITGWTSRCELDSVFGCNTIARPGNEGVTLNRFTDLPEGAAPKSTTAPIPRAGSREPSNPPAERPGSRRGGKNPPPYTRARRNSKPGPHGHRTLREFRRPKGNGPRHFPGFPEPGREKTQTTPKGAGADAPAPLQGSFQLVWQLSSRLIPPEQSRLFSFSGPPRRPP